MMIKLLLKSCLILALITNLGNSQEITTGNLLPNAGQGASSAQSVDNTIDKIGNSFNQFTSSNATNFSSEVEVTGTGKLSYSSTLLDITTGSDTTTQNKLNNGITLQGNTIVQNCEWSQSAYACGNRGTGRDSYSTKIQILDSNNSLLSETNQIRNNDSGYNNNAFKYTDTLIFNNTGANKFNWEWTGIDGQSNPGNLGGPNLLGANLFMIYDNSVLEESVTEELHAITKNLTESVKEVIIEEKVKVKTAPVLSTATSVVKTAPAPAPKTTAPAQKTTMTTNAPKSTCSSTAPASTKTTTASKSNETKKPEEKKSNSSPTKTATAKKESSKEQKSIQSKSGKNTTAKAESQSGPVGIDTQMAKVDSEVKDIGKNLEIKNVIKLKAMTNNEMIVAYNVPFYKEKELYKDQLNIFDKPIYQNKTLGSYILNDPIVQSKIKLINIKKRKQQLLREIEVLNNG